MPVFKLKFRRPDQPAPNPVAISNYRPSSPSIEPPKMSAWDQIRDVFDANTAMDKFKRTQTGQPAMYQDQQRAMGVKDVPMNFEQALQKNFAGSTDFLQKTSNTGLSLYDRLRQVPGQVNYAVTKDPKTLDYLNKLQASIDQREKNGIVSSEATKQGNMGAAVDDVIKTGVPLGVSGGSLMTGGGLSGLTVKSAAPKILGRETFTGLANTAQQFVTSDKSLEDRIKDLPGNAAANIALSVGLGTLGYGGGKLVNNLKGNVIPKVNAKVSSELADSGQVGSEVAMVKAGQLDIGADATGKLDKKTVAKYVNDIQTGKTIEPLVVSIDGDKALVQDGKHRLAAMKQLGITDVPVVEKLQTTRPYAGVQAQIERARNAGDMEKVMTLSKQLPEDVRGGIVPEAATGKLVVDPVTKKISRVADVPTEPQVDVKTGLLAQTKQALVDSDSPIIDTLRAYEKKTGKTGLVDQFMYDSGLVTRSNAIANQKVASSTDLSAALRGLSKSDLTEFNTYSAARSELANAKRGLTTSTPLDELQAIVAELDDKYAARFQSMNKYYQSIAKDFRDAGIIDNATYKRFISNPDYIRTQRDMSELVNQSFGKGQSYSLGTSLTTQKRTGSTREILPADLTALDYAQRSQAEIQRNQVATNLIDSLQEMGLATPLKASNATRKNTIKRIVNGKVEIFEVPREIKEVVDNINPYQLNALQQIVAAPKRLFQAGTTGLSAPFAAANFGKDQLGSAVNSKNVMQTHSPRQIFAGLQNASKDFAVENSDPLWQKFLAHSGDVTQFDLLRNDAGAKAMSRQIRTGQSGRLGNMMMQPIRSLEDLVSITEKATRFQNFKGIYEGAIKEGASESMALQKATLAAWQNSVDFNRFGTWGKTLNLLIPYFNSGIQGSRQLVRSFSQRPVATSMKTLGYVGLPLIGVTAWALSDPDRKAVYDNISEFEKENNFILIPPGPLGQNEDGTYNVYKVPMPQGFSNLVTPLRRTMESFANQSPLEFQKIAQDILGAVSGPINTNSPQQAVAGLIPQAIKPLVQQAANKDFFTGKDIVPDYVDQATDKNGRPVPENQKSFKYTSGTADIVGNTLGVSPIRVEKFLKDTFGRIGQYGTNALDTVLASQGAIPQDKVGGVSPMEDITRRFTKAQGEYNYMKSEGGKYFDRVKAATKNLNVNENAAFNTLHPSNTNFTGEDIFDENKRVTKYTRAGVYLQFPKVYEADKALDAEQRAQGKPGNPMFDLTHDQLVRVLLKATLPAGSKDPELSKLYQQEWYQDYNAKRSKYYQDIQSQLAKEGKSLPKSDNPYPAASAELQGAMSTYSSLPKGTGARSSWIKSNPKLWAAMTNQWSSVDAWENKERVALGLSAIAAEDQLTGATAGSSSNKSSSYNKRSYTPNIYIQPAKKPSLKTGKPKIGGGRVSKKAALVRIKKA